MENTNHSVVITYRIVRKALCAATAVACTIALGFGRVQNANASIYETRVPETSGTFERGFWHGSWNATPTHSEVWLYSNQYTEYCEAAQNGQSNWKFTSAQQDCEVKIDGNSIVTGDYVKYGLVY